MRRNWVVFVVLFLLLLLSGVSSVEATPPVKVVSGVVTNVVSALVKWLWSLKSNTKPAVSSRSMMKFEGGYSVETVFDGGKHGIEPFSVELSPSGELFILDSENSNVYRVPTPLSRYSQPKLIAGSSEGFSGHVDGKLKEARMNHPKGLTVDDRGNVYIADTVNMAIRKISDGGVTTIAGGKWARGSGHVDGPSEDAKFSNDFDVVYIGSSCSLLVVDRGNQAIREIQLQDDDCNYQYDGNYHLGVAVLSAAGFFGYMLALLQRRVQSLFSSDHNSRAHIRRDVPMAPYQMPPKSVRPPMIPNEDEYDKPEEGFFGSVGKLVVNTGSTVGDIFGGMFTSSRKKAIDFQLQQQYLQQPLEQTNPRPMQESFFIPDEDEPQPIVTRTPKPNSNYPIMPKDRERHHHVKQDRVKYNGWDDDLHQNQIQQQQRKHHHQQQQQMQQLLKIMLKLSW